MGTFPALPNYAPKKHDMYKISASSIGEVGREKGRCGVRERCVDRQIHRESREKARDKTDS